MFQLADLTVFVFLANASIIMLELTLQKATDLNDIVQKSLEKGEVHSDGFEMHWYRCRVRTDFSEDYCYHLHSLMKFYNEKYNRNWITTGDRGYVRANSNTGYFFSQGGYLNILELETRDQKIKELTDKQLQKNIFQLKYWWWILIFSAIISAIVTAISKLLPI